METVIGFLELLGWIVGVVSLAAIMTFAVVKLFPGRDEKPAEEPADSEPAGS